MVVGAIVSAFGVWMDVWVSVGVLGRWEIQITNGKK
jgi:hypothetical protein